MDLYAFKGADKCLGPREGEAEMNQPQESRNCGNYAMCGFELPGSGDCASVFSVFWERHCPKMQNVSGAGKEVVGKAR